MQLFLVFLICFNTLFFYHWSQISFRSDELGKFDEEFQWKLEGRKHPLYLRIKGMVIGPTFQFDCPSIDFGHIPCGFTASKEVVLYNTSEIPMTYHLRVRCEIKLLSVEVNQQQKPPPESEFVVQPTSGVILPGSQLLIQVCRLIPPPPFPLYIYVHVHVLACL